MNLIKLPAVAGAFYPADAQTLRKVLRDCLAGSLDANAPHPRAILAPHAGYQYSGAIAGNAYRILSQMPEIRRVVLFGPAHYVPVKGVALPSYHAFRTPLGNSWVDRDAIQALLSWPDVAIIDAAFAREHSLEVQLPFLQTLLPACQIIPILVGRAEPTLIADLMRYFINDTSTLIIVSSDLSHYHNYETAQQIDEQTLAAIVDNNESMLAPERACGSYAIKGLLAFATQQSLVAHILDARNSGDTAGDKQRVVGYCAVHFYDGQPAIETVSEQAKKTLLHMAKSSIEYGIKHHKPGQVNAEQLPPFFHKMAATFVTLTKQGHLRGCIGSLQARLSLADDVTKNAYAAAFQDPRFPPLTEQELPEISIEISILSSMTPFVFTTETELVEQFRPHIDGVLIRDNNHSGVFLPIVWRNFPDKIQFWQALKQKANLPPGYWSDTLKAWWFTTQKMG